MREEERGNGRMPAQRSAEGAALTEHAMLAARVGERLHRLSMDATRLVDVYARRRGMRSGDVHALLAIRLAELGGEPATPGDLSHTQLLTSGAVTGLVDRLVRSGMVRREPDAVDRRRVRLRVSDGGLTVAGELMEMLGARTDGVASAFSIAELSAVERFLGEVGIATTTMLWALEAPDVGRSPN
ncbi:hypothetical protein GCM10009836_10960 [Pseudonocardia ailaonensis]|uniref:HTH marR-type domain-containing protein n=1 Tax=Pseudonocardia ailaonensis TaxID=367279 RepID=A0ABN2MQ74_9PSEU